MPKSFFRTQLPLLLLCGAIMISLIAWKEDRFAQTKITSTDTVPKKGKKAQNLDEAIKELDKAQLELERSIKEIPFPLFDKDKMQANIDKALKSIDVDKMQMQVDEAMRSFDPEKIKTHIEMALKQIDHEKIKESVDEAMKEIDGQKIKIQVDAAIAKLDLEKMKVELEQLKKTELPKLQVEIEKIKPQVEAEIKKAKIEVEKAKTQLKEYKAFEDALEKDGLINKQEHYTIEHKDGQLIINGNLQPEAVYRKHRSFLEKHKNFKLEKGDSDFEANLE